MMSLLNLLNTGADVVTAVNTARTARDIEQQTQMEFDAMTPEQQARVIAAAKARAEIHARLQRRAQAIFLAIGVVVFLVIVGIMGH
jgi:hypothetical protein